MALVVPTVGDVELLKAGLGVAAMNATMTLKLFTNNITPGKGDTAGSYTEAAGFGYAAKTLTGTSWSVSVGAVGSYAQQTWTFTGALGNVYGYFVIRADSGVVILSEKFVDGPYNIANNGDQISITPNITAN